MSPQSTPFRIFALGFALTLMAGLVYIRSGGNLWADISRATSPPDDVQRLEAKVDQLERKIDALLAAQSVPLAEPVMPVSVESSGPPAEFLPGPKSAPMFLPTDAPPTPPRTVELLPGSKRDSVINPEQLQAVVGGTNTGSPDTSTPTVTRVLPGTTLPGSKSAVMVLPSDVKSPEKPVANRPVQPAPQRLRSAYEGGNDSPSPAPKLLPGSKSPGVLISPSDIQSTPAPAQQPAAQQAKPATKSRAMLPGSKSKMVLDPADFRQASPQQQQARAANANEARP